MKLNWNQKFIDDLEQRIEENAEKAAKSLVREFKTDINTTGEPSKPGEFPKKQTGKLRAGVTYEKVDQESIIIGSEEEYGETLAKSGRRFVPETFYEHRDRVARITIKGR